METTKPKRRWLRFSLRTFFIAVTILCCWLGWKINAARKQRDAVAAIRAHQNAGGAYYDVKEENESWMAKRFGPDLFYDVRLVVLNGILAPNSPDEVRGVLPLLANLKRLESLTISDSPFQDEDFQYVADLKNLNRLEIMYSQITGSGFRQLAGLQRLRRLILTNNPICDEHLEQLPELIRLDNLQLDQTKVTNAGLHHLKRLPNLSSLSLSDNQIDDDGLLRLAELTNLAYVNVAETDVTQAGIDRFKKLRPEMSIHWCPKNLPTPSAE